MIVCMKKKTLQYSDLLDGMYTVFNKPPPIY